jgi:tetratricopeptide (TPR) repeat protein
VAGDESTEWCRVQLGHLYENNGDNKNAEMNYTIALDNRKNYAYALAGMARIALSNKTYDKAINYYQQADSLVNDFSFKEELVDVYQLTGQKDKAAAISKIVIDEMNKNAASAASDENIGHYADRELAYAYLKINEVDKALDHALAEYNRRPKNIDANETLAWVYYQKGAYAKAIPYMRVALKTNSKNPVLLCRAGLIFEKIGDKVKAKEYLEQAFKNNATLPELLKLNSEQALKEI